ncbi:MAG: hypothetical protein GXP53_13740 [Deltaproteobacteria bacterium]|nr:hypothetical protein [Deltaproteobacteria bacterium]
MIKPIFRLTPRKAVLVIFAICLSCFVLGLSSAYADTTTQIVTLNASPDTPTVDDTVTVGVDYDVSPVDNTLPGLDLKIFYDSNKLTYIGYDNYFTRAGDFGANPDNNAPSTDTDNLDGDTSTDKFLIISWGALAGNWPGDDQTLPLRLVDLKFTPLSEATSNVNVKIQTVQYLGEEHNTTVTVTCPTATIDSFSADNTGLCSGQSATLSWATTA